ncbi:hypothetical protein Vretimale_60 [Volvox reticuliferus]|uniref:Uncharacterized protein n=1 Tax=Volvox reticuliferus TaxID=1737510 RepID=A0A8J4D2I9_9CHLO|nr:hypothetical protein Vretimale_60 [Volvox reticuliferus]
MLHPPPPHHGYPVVRGPLGAVRHRVVRGSPGAVRHCAIRYDVTYDTASYVDTLEWYGTAPYGTSPMLYVDTWSGMTLMTSSMSYVDTWSGTTLMTSSMSYTGTWSSTAAGATRPHARHAACHIARIRRID